MVWLCLALSLALLAFGALTFVRIQSMALFFVSVGATEFGHMFAPVALVLAVLTPKDSPVGIATSAIAALAAVFLVSPLARAFACVSRLRRTFAHGLGVEPRRRVFHFARLFLPETSHRPFCEKIVIEGAGGPLQIDFFRAESSRPAPLILIVHGGGWMAGSVDELGGWNAWLARSGFAVASVDYRLVPTGPWPSQREDVLAAVAHLRANAASLGLDPMRIVLFGRSAGGQIASAVAAGGFDGLCGCVCLYAPFDLEFAYRHSSNDDILRSRWLLRCFLGGTPEEVPEAYRDASAYLTARKGMPPFLFFHGSRDDLVWVAQSERFSQRLGELEVSHAFLRLPWATHAFDYNMSGPGGQVVAEFLGAFLRKVCGSEQA
jgi:acetyl esterase/lipase